MGEGQKTAREVLILHETIAQSIGRDAVTYVGLLAVIGVGVWIESEALQWIAGIMWLIGIIGRTMIASNKHVHRLTPQAAAQFLADKFAAYPLPSPPEDAAT